MASTTPYIEFAPPKAASSPGAMALAILAHAALLAVLTMGVQWNSEPVTQTFEAELWSAIPVEAAAPAAPEPAPEPPKPAPPEVKPEPLPAPKAPPQTYAQAEAAIALARAKDKEKAKELKEKKLALEKLEAEKKKLAEQEKQLEKDKKEKAEKLARAKEEQQRKQDLKDAQQVAEQRQKAIKRMEGLAGAGGSGATSSSNTAAQSSGPSASYAGKIVAAIKPNITYPENVSGNPRAEVEIRAASSGLILSTRITQSSGVKSWDEAVLRAIEKTEKLPRDTDGTVQTLLVMGFRPKD